MVPSRSISERARAGAFLCSLQAAPGRRSVFGNVDGKICSWPYPAKTVRRRSLQTIRSLSRGTRNRTRALRGATRASNRCLFAVNRVAARTVHVRDSLKADSQGMCVMCQAQK